MIKSITPFAVESPTPLAAPHLAGNEWRYVQDCLDTGWVSSVGSYVERFERELAQHAWVRHAVATSSGTAALHLALVVAGVKPDEEVITSTLTFIAPANAIRYVGAHPVFIDAEPNTWQIYPNLIDEFLRHRCESRDGRLINRQTGRPVAAILPVHIMGHPVDLDAITALARRFNLPVIEDAAEAVGADYKGRPVGQTDWISVYSFNGNKIITTGGGGALLTDRADWAERARYLSTQAKDDAVESIHGEVGFNYRLTNVQAAIGLAQLEQLEEFVAHKRAIARRYAERLADVPGLSLMPEAAWARSTYWLYTVQIDERAFGIDRKELGQRLQRMGIQTRPLWQPMHRSPAHANTTTMNGDVADRLHRQSISLPCSVGLDLQVVDNIADIIRSIAHP